MKLSPEVKELRKKVRELKYMEKLYAKKIHELYDRLEYQRNAMWTLFIDYRASKVLTPRLYKLLKIRWGIEGEKTHTLEDAGREFGVTRERIRQMEAKAAMLVNDVL